MDDSTLDASFSGPHRLSKTAEELEKLFRFLGVNAVCLGFVIGMNVKSHQSLSWLAMIATWICYMLPKALGSTAQMWAHQIGQRLLQRTFERQSEQMTRRDAKAFRKKLKLKLKQIEDET